MTARLLAPLLLLLLSLPAFAARAEAPVEGRDYVLIPDGRPLQPADGKVEVVEIFAYTCHHCANFQPQVDTWLRKRPQDVRFVYLPAAFRLEDNYARGYFAAESLGALGKFHHAAFDAVHKDQSLPAYGASAEEIAAFAGTLGIDRARFLAAMTDPATEAKMQAARDFAVRTDVPGTPSVIVNGKYRVQGRSFADVLRITDALIAQERAR